MPSRRRLYHNYLLKVHTLEQNVWKYREQKHLTQDMQTFYQSFARRLRAIQKKARELLENDEEDRAIQILQEPIGAWGNSLDARGNTFFKQTIEETYDIAVFDVKVIGKEIESMTDEGDDLKKAELKAMMLDRVNTAVTEAGNSKCESDYVSALSTLHQILYRFGGMQWLQVLKEYSTESNDYAKKRSRDSSSIDEEEFTQHNKRPAVDSTLALDSFADVNNST